MVSYIGKYDGIVWGGVFPYLYKVQMNEQTHCVVSARDAAHAREQATRLNPDVRQTNMKTRRVKSLKRV